MVNWLYSEKVRKHFFNPVNVQLNTPEPHEFNATATIGSIVCGDMMQVWLRIDKVSEIIEKMTWKTFGCATAIASTSVLSEMVAGKTLEQAREIKAEDIVKSLEGLPQNKIHCSVMGDKALRMAINNYYRSTCQTEMIRQETGKVIDTRLIVTDEEVKDLIRQGTDTLQGIQEHLKVGVGDKALIKEIEKILEDERQGQKS